MIRVLIAEDSMTCLGLLTAIIETDPALKLIGHAANGAAAVSMTRELRPDVVLMDIHMPIMDGFEATRQIMVDAPTPIVIVSATVNVREVAVSMHALRVGALAVLPKPGLTGKDDFVERAREFTASVRAMSAVRVVQRWEARSLPPSTPPSRSSAQPTIVAVAASTGGPGAIYRVLSELPADFPLPILVVQHIAKGFVDGLAAWLDGASPLTVKVAEHAEALQPGRVYVAPDDQHLGVSGRRTVALSKQAAVAGFRPSGTFLFDSVAEHHRSGAVAVILTGMGEDGLPGLRKVREAHGRVLAQDAETSVVFGMPGAAVAAGLADMTLPIDMIAARLQHLVADIKPRERERL